MKKWKKKGYIPAVRKNCPKRKKHKSGAKALKYPSEKTHGYNRA